MTIKKLTLFFINIFFFIHLHATNVDTETYGCFGLVKIYSNSEKPSSIAIFISGDGGWKSGVVDMAQSIASLDVMVIGVDINKYFAYLRKLTSACYYPAADFENLSKFIQKKRHLTHYLSPVLIGYSSGATLAYGILAQAPENTFIGAMGLGFCPDIDLPKHLCKGAGLECSAITKKGYDLLPVGLKAPFVALLGENDRVCSPPDVKIFIDKTPKSELILLPKVGHGFAVEKNWMPQFIGAYKHILTLDEEKRAKLKTKETESGAVKPKEAANLPVKLIPTTKPAKALIFMISGDGGWTGFDQQLAEHLAEQAYPVVGLDALQYFWSEKTPAGVIKDITPVINHYMKEWKCDEVILLGYSFGANVIPFLVNDFSPEIKGKIKLVAMMSPDEKADFEIHISDMINIFGDRGDYNVKAEMLKMKEKTLLIFGSDEVPTKFDDLPKKQFKQVTISGGHHYGNNFDALANGIVNATKE